jgi:MFS family permease
MIVAARVILGAGVGLEGGTVPVYVAETVESRLRGNLVSLYQLNIALGEVLGYAVAAMFITVDGNWRYILGSSLVFSTIMGVGILFMPESPRFLMASFQATALIYIELTSKTAQGQDARGVQGLAPNPRCSDSRSASRVLCNEDQH